MLISTEAGTGEILSARDETRFYDDVGCLAADWRTRPHDATAWVRLGDGGWSDARAAFYARPPAEQTAMGFGFKAYGTAAEAGAADRDGHALTWNEIVSSTGERR